MFPSLHRIHAPAVIILFSALLSACKTETKPIRPDGSFAPYINAFTSGHTSARGPVQVRLAEGIVLTDTSSQALQQLFDLKPKTPGRTVWLDQRTLAFQPDERLQQDKDYVVTFHLGKLAEVEPEFGEFKFSFSTLRQNIELEEDDMLPHSPNNLEWQRVVLRVFTGDDATGQDLGSAVTATQDGRTLKMTWEHEPGGTLHRVVADSVRRSEEASSVEFAWDERKIGGRETGSLFFHVPAIGDFDLIRSEATAEGEQSISLLFSDPLNPSQDLDGLAGIRGVEGIRLSVNGNKLVLHLEKPLSGEQSVFVAGGLQNAAGRSLGRDLDVEVQFEEAKPNVRMVGKGTILPSTDGLLLPFEAVNLSAVDVRVVRIYEDNVPQFLQGNRLAGNEQLTRVGRLVLRKTLALEPKDGARRNLWQRYYLDLDQLVRTEPGAIYRIIFGYKKEYSLYPCGGVIPTPPLISQEPQELNDASWDRPGSYYYDDDDDEYDFWDDYNWRDRNDPCTPSYFHGKGSVAKQNILASDLGLIAKRGNDGSLVIAASDLRTTEPQRGVEVKVLDMQRRTMAKATTGKDGLVTIPNTVHKPFLLVAAKGKQRGYLRMDDGSSLSMSRMEVGGTSVEKGLKGFLYGERGVWRPGDSLYLTFILQQAEQRLPDNIPVTMEFRDPMGRMQDRIVRTAGTGGTYAFRLHTAPEAPTGVWEAKVSVGGTSFYKPIRIETVKPNRLKIQMDLGGERLTIHDGSMADLQVNWLHGAPAKGLTARVTANLTRARATFKGLKKYDFDDLSSDLNTDEIDIYEGQLDDNGRASFPFKLDLNRRVPSAVKANIVTRVFEAGGDASMDRFDVQYYPYASYAGLLVPESTGYWGTYFTDTTYTLGAIAVDPRGKAMPYRQLKVQVVKVSNNWWWSDDLDNPNNYMAAPSTRVISEELISTDAQGKASFPFRVDKPEWGNFVVRLSDPISGHASAVKLYMDWPGYAGRSRRDSGTEAAMLSFNSDKEKYSTGEHCELTIPSSGKGRALISLENGSRVLETKWIELKGNETKYSFPITAEMAPNIYAHVAVVQPHATTSVDADGNDLPIRLYGVIPIFVEDANTHLNPAIACAAEFKTDQEFTVEVSEKDGKAMTYTLAIVDEGLLDLTRFKTPDPWNHFYAKEALGVRTWDLYDEVIGAFGQRLRRVLALGGSDQVNPAEAAKAQRFKPVVRFVGPFTVAKGKKASHRFTINNYVGSVRVMVVANTPQGTYGHAEKAVPVKKPLMLLATLPRVAGPGETMDLPVTVFAMDPKVKDVKLSLAANELFTVEGSKELVLTFAKTGEQVATFRVKMKDAQGVGKVTVTATGAGEKATQSIELDVRPAGQPETHVTEAIIQPGGSWEALPEAVGVAGTNSAYLELSTMPPVDMGRRLQYLIDYPHGCLEQTTSRAFAQLYIADVMDVSATTKDAMRRHVQAGLDHLKQFQTGGGGFGYWPGDREPDNWTSTYAGHFMVEAERKGFAAPAGVKEAWVAYTRKQARNWTPGSPRNEWSRQADELAQAYRLYALALNNTAESGAMNRMRTTPRLSQTARWMLAAAYALNNRKDVAREIAKDLSTSVAPYRELSWTYGSDLRDQSVIAEALMRMDDKAQAAILVRQIGEQLSGNYWCSTQTTAWSLLAVSRFAMGSDLDRTMHFTATVNGKTDNRVSDRPMVRLDLPLPDGKRKAAITNTGNNVLYVRLIRTGTPAAGQETVASNGLAMEVEYRSMSGNPIDPSKLDQGTDFQAVVTVRNPGIRGAYRELALVQVFPSGWEIRNSRLEETEGIQQNSYFNYQDIRDDRVMTYFDLAPGDKATYRVLLNAAYTGRFHLPSTTCSAMYDNTVNARNGGQWVRVVKPGE